MHLELLPGNRYKEGRRTLLHIKISIKSVGILRKSARRVRTSGTSEDNFIWPLFQLKHLNLTALISLSCFFFISWFLLSPLFSLLPLLLSPFHKISRGCAAHHVDAGNPPTLDPHLQSGSPTVRLHPSRLIPLRQRPTQSHPRRFQNLPGKTARRPHEMDLGHSLEDWRSS